MFVPRRKWLRIDDSNIPFRSGNGEAWDCYNRRVSDSNIPFRSGNDARLWTLPDRGERFKYSFQVWKRRNCSAALHHIHRFKYSFQVWKLVADKLFYISQRRFKYSFQVWKLVTGSGAAPDVPSIQIFLSGLETTQYKGCLRDLKQIQIFLSGLETY